MGKSILAAHHNHWLAESRGPVPNIPAHSEAPRVCSTAVLSLSLQSLQQCRARVAVAARPGPVSLPPGPRSRIAASPGSHLAPSGSDVKCGVKSDLRGG